MIMGTIEIYLQHDLFYIFHGKYIESYKKESFKFFSKLVEMNREEGIIYLLGFWRTWDHYKIGLHILEIIKDELRIEIPELQEKLLLFVHPNPEKRPSLLEHRIINKKMLSNSQQGYGSKVFVTKVEKSRLIESIKTYKN
jgi:hypothetical protein